MLPTGLYKKLIKSQILYTYYKLISTHKLYQYTKDKRINLNIFRILVFSNWDFNLRCLK